MATTETECILCHHKKATIIANKLRCGLEKEVCQCQKCSLVFIKPPHVSESDPDYYKKAYRKTYKAPTPREYFNMSLETSRQRFERIKKFLKKSDKIIEVGSASGSMLHVLIENGFENAEGIELDKAYGQFCFDRFGYKIYQCRFEDVELPENCIDKLISFHVLEHALNPVEFAQKSYSLLKKDGLFIAEVPSVDDYLLSLLDNKAYKDFYFQLSHSYYFSAKTAKLILTMAGFSKIRIIHYQRHTIMNGINWLTKYVPTGIYGGLHPSHPIVRYCNPLFSRVLELLGKTDTMLIIAQK